MEASLRSDSPSLHSLYLLLFFLSGICGLVYEVVWSRMLALTMGNTVFASSTVLAAVMGGLALGSWFLGRIIDRHQDTLGLYGLLEFLLGLYCLGLPWLLEGMVPIYRALYQFFGQSPYLLTFAQLLFSSVSILIPSALMGGTLPVMTKAFARGDDRIASTAGRLYAVNTVGAVLGALAAGYVLIPGLGVRATLFGAAFANLAIGAAAILLARRRERRTPPLATRRLLIRPGDPPRGEAWMVLLAFSVSGATALIYEVAWTRTLSLLVGPSVYAFSLMLGAFISGLALGSFLLAGVVDRFRRLLTVFALLQWGVAFTAMGMIPLIDFLPGFIREAMRSSGGSFLQNQMLSAGIAFAVMLVPAAFLGGAFPVAIRLYSRSLESLGKRLGTLYAGNTIGAVAGSLAAGFVFIPSLGLQNTLLAAAFINGLVAVVLLFLSKEGRWGFRIGFAAVPALLLVIAAMTIPSWSRLNLTSGPYKYFRQDEATMRGMLESSELLYHREGVTGTVSVRQTGEKRILSISGKVDSSSGKTDMVTQLLLGHLPMLAHGNPKEALVIGLASGVTLGAVAQYPVDRMDAVEISYEVREAAAFFSDVNRDVLRDGRVKIIIQDGRNHLLLTDSLYDVIISEPSNPWMAGIGSLYTREFFELARARLHPGGIMAQWIEAYHMPNPILKSVVRTFQSVFPHAGLWVTDPSDPGDIILIGSVEPVRFDVDRVRRDLSRETVRADLSGVGSHLWWQVAQRLAAGTPELAEAVSDAPIHADDLPFMEFELPKSLHADTLLENAVWLDSLIRRDAMAPFRETLPWMSEQDRAVLIQARAELAFLFQRMVRE